MSALAGLAPSPGRQDLRKRLVTAIVLGPLFLAAVALADRELIAAHGRQWWRSGRWWVATARQTLVRYLAWLACAARG